MWFLTQNDTESQGSDFKFHPTLHFIAVQSQCHLAQRVCQGVLCVLVWLPQPFSAGNY